MGQPSQLDLTCKQCPLYSGMPRNRESHPLIRLREEDVRTFAHPDPTEPFERFDMLFPSRDGKVGLTQRPLPVVEPLQRDRDLVWLGGR